MKVSKFRAILLLLFAMSLIAAACGGGDDDADDGGDTGTTAAATDDGGDDGGTATTSGASGEAVEVRWFVGLGAGTDAPLIPLQQAIVDEFNATKPAGDNITIKLDVAPSSDEAATLLQTQLAGGNSPDIVGPVGVKGAAQFFGGWLDLTAYLADYDTSDYDPSLVEFWNQDGVQIGLPFAVFPQVLWYNKELFDEAGLAYPPAEHGAPYVDADGNEKPWDIDTLRELAMELTVDSSGNTPNDAGFNRDNLVQWGFDNGYAEFRGQATMFGAGSFVAADQATCQFPDNWAAAAQWYHDAIWKDAFYPDPVFAGSELLAGDDANTFGTGNMAMMTVHTWYQGWGPSQLTGGDNTDPNDVFDVAPMPAVDGVITAKLHGDTFGIMKQSAHPAEAFAVLEWMLSPEIAPQLAAIYGGIPARESTQEAYITDPANDFGYSWATALEALEYPDIPSHEAWWPNYQESQAALDDWWLELRNDPNADIGAAVGSLCDTLQPIYDRAG
jgi:multiple sugar transport system substrate-binding protein